MLDPFPPPPSWLSPVSEPLSKLLSLPTLPLHLHEILLAFAVYHTIYLYLSPFFSTLLFPRHYPQLPAKTRLNWDVHVVSLVQSLLINTLAIWVIINDHERKGMDWRGRVWGYTGAAGLVQGLAAGYFLWDLMVTATHVELFGWGMLLHAVCALGVFGCGFVCISFFLLQSCRGHYFGGFFFIWPLPSYLACLGVVCAAGGLSVCLSNPDSRSFVGLHMCSPWPPL